MIGHENNYIGLFQAHGTRIPCNYFSKIQKSIFLEDLPSYHVLEKKMVPLAKEVPFAIIPLQLSNFPKKLKMVPIF